MSSWRQARLEEEARRRKVAHAPAHEMQSPARKNVRGRRVGDFLASVLWEKLEISSRRSLRCGKKTSPEKFARKVAGGECFLTTIRPTGKSFPGIDDTGKLERIRFSLLVLRTGTDGRNERWPEREMARETWPK